MEDLKYTTDNLFDIKELTRSWLNEINDLTIQKRIIDEKIDMLYEHIGRVERHINAVEKQNKSTE